MISRGCFQPRIFFFFYDLHALDRVIPNLLLVHSEDGLGGNYMTFVQRSNRQNAKIRKKFYTVQKSLKDANVSKFDQLWVDALETMAP